MSLIKANGAGEVSTGFYKGVATQSLRLDGGTEITLDNAGSATSNKISTISVWFKRADEISTLAYLFHSKNDGSFGDGSNGLASFSITLDADDNISVVQYNGNPSFNANQYDFGVKLQNKIFRDTGSWYHLVVAIDTTQGSGTTNEADRIKMYVNGVQQTVVAISDGSGYQDFADENQLVAVNQDGEQRWGGTVDDGTYAHVYLAEINVVDGLQLTPSNFGETKNGIWIAKSPNVSEYGNHGYRLQFKETGVGAGASDTVGADTSGKNNHFTTHSNIAVHDCALPDSPENNWCTMNPLSPTQGSPNFAEGSLKVSISSNAYSYFQSSFGVTSGKWYAEYRVVTVGSTMVGIAESNMEKYYTGANNDPHLTGGTAWYVNGSHGYFDGSSVSGGTFSSSTSYTNGDIIALALDMDSSTKTIKFYKNGSLVNTTNLNANFNEHIVFASNMYSTTAGVWNFGQDGSFAGILTGGDVGTETDGNGLGKFKYSVPSGYLALSSSNLDDDNYATLGPNSDNNTTDFFTTTYYAGTNDATRTFDLGFVSDWAWFKGDSSGYGHQMYDSSRGVQKYLRSNTTGTEVTNSEGVLDFDDSGNLLKIGTDAFLNESGTSVSLWTWRINGGTTATNSNGSADSTVQVNTTVGMSLVLYTGNSTGSGSEQTIGHGLGVIPDVIMFKSRTYASQNWYIHHKGLANGVTTHVELDTNDLEHGDADYMNEVAPTSSVFSLGHNFTTNKSGESYIAYCFKSVEGYSKYGNFTGNGSTNGVFVYLGFRPQLIIAKCSSHSGSWHMVDATRDNNPIGYYNTDNADAYGDYAHYDILSNGFKVRDNGTESNRSGGTFIYMAWANSPFKYANAR